MSNDVSNSRLPQIVKAEPDIGSQVIVVDSDSEMELQRFKEPQFKNFDGNIPPKPQKFMPF